MNSGAAYCYRIPKNSWKAEDINFNSRNWWSVEIKENTRFGNLESTEGAKKMYTHFKKGKNPY
jgi:hypothetical protein